LRDFREQDEDIAPHLMMMMIIIIGKTIHKEARLWAQLHFNICNETGVKLDNAHWYEHVTK
jgi:hypothetical protein